MLINEFSNNLIGKKVILEKSTGDTLSGELVGIIRDSIFIEVDGQEYFINLEDILSIAEGEYRSENNDRSIDKKENVNAKNAHNLKNDEIILKETLEQKPLEEFEKLRCKIFVSYYDITGLESLKQLLDIGYPISEGEDFVFEVKECLADKQFGLIRSLIRQKETGLECDTLNEAKFAFDNDIEKIWEDCKDKKDQQRGIKLIIEAECVGVSATKIKNISEDYKKKFAKEIRSWVENCNLKKLNVVFKDAALARSYGYTGKEIKKYKNVLEKKSFPMGKSDYEKAVRLVIFGFADDGMQFYKKVANDNGNIKKDAAVNQLLNYAITKKDYQLFDRYYNILDKIDKKKDPIRQLKQQELYELGEFNQLYSLYADMPETCTDYAVKGALLFAMGRVIDTRREELIRSVMDQNSFDGKFWLEALEKAYSVSADMYWEILYSIFEKYPKIVLNHSGIFYQCLGISPALIEKMHIASVEDLFSAAYPTIFPCVIYQANECTFDNMRREQYIYQASASMKRLLEQMNFENAKLLGNYFGEKAPENESIRVMTDLAQKGLNLQDMLPEGQDDYSIGRRLLLLNEDKENALRHFQHGVECSDDQKQITLCGTELLKMLMNEENYSEVIAWGKRIILDKKIPTYTSFAIDLKTAYEKNEDEKGKEDFVNELIRCAEEARIKGDYSRVMSSVDVIRVFNPDHIYVKKNTELSELIRQGKINLEDDSFIGTANKIRYIEGDIDKYISWLFNGFVHGGIDVNQITDAAIAYINVCIEEGLEDKLFQFIDKIGQYKVPMNEQMVTILFDVIVQKKSVQSAISYFTSFLENAKTSKPALLFSRLEQLYERAILENISFDIATATEQMHFYIKQGASDKTKYCYIALLASAGDMRTAAELFALMDGETQVIDNAMIIFLREKYFKEKKPDLSEIFAKIVKENTYLQLIEYVQERKDFVLFSSEEKKFYNRLRGEAKINPNDTIGQKVLIKGLYLKPDNWKYWYLYNLAFKEQDDVVLIYCINIILSILDNKSMDLRNTAGHIAKTLFKENNEIKDRYGCYELYNLLYKSYRNKTYLNNKDLLGRIYKMSKNDKYFKGEPEFKEKIAKDYIYLLKQMDTRDDYFYVKTAMFLATNYNCEEYFYNLFRNELLKREQNVCLQMCIEILTMQKQKGKVLVNRILRDIENEVKTENKTAVSELRKLCENGSDSDIYRVCCLLHRYPLEPAEKEIRKLNLLQIEKESAIMALRIADNCIGDSLAIKRLLFQVECLMGDPKYYEELYQKNLDIIQNIQLEKIKSNHKQMDIQLEQLENQLCEACCIGIVLALALGKKERFVDIIDLYGKQSLENSYADYLNDFCKAAYQIDEKNWKSSSVLEALIFDDWGKVFISPEIIELIETSVPIRVLLDIKLDIFVKAGVEFLNSAVEEGDDDLVREWKKKLILVFQVIFKEPLDGLLDEICAMDDLNRRIFINSINLSTFNINLSDIPNKKSFIDLLVHLWSLCYQKKLLFIYLMNVDKHIKCYHLLMKTAISRFHMQKLLDYYAKTLFMNKMYDNLVEFDEYKEWAQSKSDFFCFYNVALCIVDFESGIEEIIKTEKELFVGINLLLLKNEMWDILERIQSENPQERKTMEFTRSIYFFEEDDALMVDFIEKIFPDEENQRALFKLLYAQTRDVKVKRLLESRIEDIESTITLMFSLFSEERIKKSKERELSAYNILLEQNDDVSLIELAEYEPEFLKESFRDISVDQITKDDKYDLERLYANISGDLQDNLEYRRECLTKLCYITADSQNIDKHINYVIWLGLVLYYGRRESNRQEARNFLYEIMPLIVEKDNINVLFPVRDAFYEMLAGFETMNEIYENKDNINKSLDCMCEVPKFNSQKAPFVKFKGIIDELVQIRSLNSISQTNRAYSQVIKKLQKEMYYSRPEWKGTYRQWYKLVKNTQDRVKKGAVLNLEMETHQCQRRGKIFGVIRNVGKQKANDIQLKVIFPNLIHCKESECFIPTLYGEEMKPFAFSIRCDEEGEFDYRVEISYKVDAKINQEDFAEKIRTAAQNNYEFIGELYSIAPVTSNEEFYGRDKEKEKIFGFLNNIKFNTSMVMYGLKRVGKTSMLRYIERSMADSEIYIPIYRSAQSLGGQNFVRDMFVRSVTDALDNCGLGNEKCRSYLVYDYNLNPEQLYDFYEYLQKADILKGKRILLMADEIEEVFNHVDQGLVNQRFYKVLRAILQELTSVRFIFCGADYLTDILRNHPLADVFESTERVPIKRLDQESMQRMIKEPAREKVSYTENAIDRIWDYTRGHTYYSKVLCQSIIEFLNEETRMIAYAYDVDKAIRQVMNNTEYFSYLTQFFTPNDRQVIGIMCDNIYYSKGKVSYDILNEHYEGAGLSETLSGLEFKDIIEEDEYNTEYYDFSIEMFRLWFSKEGFSAKMREEMEE